MSKYKYAIVIGASSGIGREIAQQLADSGCRVAAIARRTDRLEQLAGRSDQILPFTHDVRDVESIPALFQEVTGQLGGLDLVVYASGAMPKVRPDEFDLQKDQSILDVNVRGAVGWLNEAATRFQAVGHGTIVGISSVAGERGRAGQPAYNASKAFLNTYLEALRNRLSKRNVVVTTIKPGPVDTEMTADLDLKRPMSAETAASLILKKASSGRECFLSPVHGVAFFIIRNIPSWLFRRLKI